MEESQPSLSRRLTMTSTGIELPIFSAEWSRNPVFPFIAIGIQQAPTPPHLTSTSDPTFALSRLNLSRPSIVSTVDVHLPDDAQINANGGLRRLLTDVKHTYETRYRSFTEWSICGPDEGRVFMILIEVAREAVHTVESMRIEIEDGFLGEVEASDMWQKMVKWEIREALTAIGRMEELRREWEDVNRCT